MTQIDPAQEWGLPDWRDANSYVNSFGPPEQWSDTRWRWEFKRRQSAYRAVFDNYVRQGRDGTIVQDDIEETDEDGNRLMVTPGLTENISANNSNRLGFMFVADEADRAKFRMCFLPNPRFSSQPNRTLLFLDRLASGIRDEAGLLPGEATYHFDLFEPLAPQIEECSHMLKHMQKLLKDAKRQKRFHRDLFLDYLQALDAKESKVSHEGLVGVLAMTKPNKDSAAKLVQQARQVRDNF